jgi:LytS/YehU family sensor histidine kinase
MHSLRLQVAIFLSIVLSTMVVNGVVNIWLNGTTKYLKYSVLWSFYISGFGALIYLFLRQNDVEKKRKLFEKELELVKLSELKTKAELDALQAKINPHFLYNALNSIADLSLADGYKAREMTLALADLFRYSINYGNSNYATVAEEMEMVNLYLQIERLRFEERLHYSVEVDKEALAFHVPRTILQPVVENAVKHGLKNLHEARIAVNIKMRADALEINVHDNGPAFPPDMKPGYGLTSLFDKLEALFPGRFEVAMHNEPEKAFKIILYKQKT